MPPRKKGPTLPTLPTVDVADLADLKHGIGSPLLASSALMRVADLTRYHKNFRKGDQAEIRKSLRVNGQYRAVCVNIGSLTGRPFEILAGNNTVQAARAEEWDVVAVGFVDYDEQAAARVVMVDNLLNDKAKNDADALAELAGSLDDLDGSGMTADELASLLSDEGDADDESALLGDTSFSVLVHCEDEAHQVEVMELLDQHGLDPRAVVQ